MRARRFLTLVLLSLCSAAAMAQLAVPEEQRLAPHAGAPPARLTHSAVRPMMIELTADPTVVAYARERQRASAKGGTTEAIANQAAVAQLSTVRAQQEPFVRALRSGAIDGHFLYAVQRVGNGIAAELTPEEADRVASMPGVRRVVPMIPLTLDLSTAVPLVGAPNVWLPATGSGHRGEGMRIGIIDTGVDYLHVGLGGAGVYSRTNFTTADVPWNAKVVGGTDLAGDAYDAGSSDAATRTPKPDPDPMDCNGHGTHVAAIAAGVGVRADGTAFNGPYTSVVDASAFRIGPGVAPAAQIYAIRVFGCGGSTVLEPQALDWAVDPNQDGDPSDHLDVVNLSIGSGFGVRSDPAAMQAADNAALAGTIVVASAGNSGATHFITGSPATAARALSVAASVDSTDTVDAFVVTAPSALAGAKPAAAAINFSWSKLIAPISGQVAYPPSHLSGCGAFAGADVTAVAGKIALLDWTENDCKSTLRVQNARAAGAIGVLFAYNGHTTIDISIAGDSSIPSMITTQAVADSIKAALPVTMSFDARLLGTGVGRVVDDSLTDTVADFSSRGPRTVDALLKPDISAPGQTIFSAEAASGNLGVSLSGTSMAAPMTTGAMALLKQIHPGWSVEELKALAMNSAVDLYSRPSKGEPLVAPAAAGAGRVSLVDAASLDVLAYAVDNPGSVGLSFGFVEVPGQTSVDRQFRVVNKSSSAANIALSYKTLTPVPGVSFAFPDGNTISIPANGSAVARLRLTAVASQMKHGRDPALADSQDGLHRYWLTEASGRIELTRGSEKLRLPVHAIVRPSSSMAAAVASVSLVAASGHTTLPTAGQSFETGTSYPDDWVSLVTPFELQETHVRKAAVSAEDNLHYVGVTSNYKAKSSSMADTTIYFGLAAFGPWTTPGEVDYEVFIDTNNDGTFDYVLFNTNSGTLLTGGSSTDVHLAALCAYPVTSLPTNGCSSQYLNGSSSAGVDTAVFDTDVMRLGVPASSLGLTDGHSKFTYRVAVFDTVTGQVADSTASLTFDPAHSLNLFATAAGGLFFDRASNPLSIDWTAGDVNSKAILLLHYFNAAGTRAEVVPITTTTGGNKRRAVKR